MRVHEPVRRERGAGRRDPFGTLHLEHASTVDRVAEELRRAVFDGELESGTPLREVAIAASLGVSRPDGPRGARHAGGRGAGHARAQPRGVGRHARRPTRCATCARPAWCSRAPASGAGARPPTSQRALVHATLDAYIAAIDADASYQELNERHLAFHVSLVGLTGSPRLVAMQENLVVELKLALAQVDRIRRNAHDQADSHAALVRLLERDDIEAAHAFLVRHLADAEDEIIEALGLA